MSLNPTQNIPPTPEKGHYGGECNRTACDGYPAWFFNSSTRMYYCQICSQRINGYAHEEICVLENRE
jgi:hypothetical protein